MPFKDHGRQYDLVLFGATGYSGKMAAEYITSNFPTNLKWAIAGRSETKLQAVIDECKVLNPDRSPPVIEILDASDEEKLTDLVKKSFAIITTVGPYCLYGEPVVKSCAESGTHYLDITGEIPWVYHMIKKYDMTAKRSGAIIIPQAGLESAAADLCTWALAKCIRKELAAKTRDVTLSLHTFRAAPSGGTLNTLLATFEHFRLQDFRDANEPFAFSPILHPAEPKRHPKSISQIIFGSHHAPGLGMVSTSIIGGTDQTQVERSWGLLSLIPSRKHEFYGPKFHFAEYRKVRNWLDGIFIHWGLFLAVALLFLVKPLRNLVRKHASQPGAGPPKEDAEKEEVEFRGIANPDTDEPVDKQAYCRAWFNGSIYLLTAIYAVEGALMLLEEEVDLPGGLLTPACLGQRYIDRLQEAGFHMEVRLQDR
ncbi:Putative trans-acting enoyl reductase [Cladobotryum mycophilum]|uniref:Trans-acting enoyl reductase n=1 Tax=Cladobotryum mycophilum TaxID=491253 RepID=A0ABR0SEB3_9HYPO